MGLNGARHVPGRRSNHRNQATQITYCVLLQSGALRSFASSNLSLEPQSVREPSNKHAAPLELDEGRLGLEAIDMALLRSF
jgi:hypothetical protein